MDKTGFDTGKKKTDMLKISEPDYLGDNNFPGIKDYTSDSRESLMPESDEKKLQIAKDKAVRYSEKQGSKDSDVSAGSDKYTTRSRSKTKSGAVSDSDTAAGHKRNGSHNTGSIEEIQKKIKQTDKKAAAEVKRSRLKITDESSESLKQDTNNVSGTELTKYHIKNEQKQKYTGKEQSGDIKKPSGASELTSVSSNIKKGGNILTSGMVKTKDRITGVLSTGISSCDGREQINDMYNSDRQIHMAQNATGKVMKIIKMPFKIIETVLFFVPGGKTALLIIYGILALLGILLLSAGMFFLIIYNSPLKALFSITASISESGDFEPSEFDSKLFASINALYDDFENETNLYVRDTSFFDTVMLYHLLINDSRGYNSYEEDDAIDNTILEKAFDFINSYTETDKMITIIQSSNAEEKKLGTYRLQFVQSATATDIEILLPHSFLKSYSYESASGLRIDLINNEKNFSLKNQRVSVQENDDGGSNILYIIYPQSISGSLLNELFPNDTSFPDINVNAVFNDSSCPVKHKTKVKQAVLKKYSDYNEYASESTYEWAEVIASVYSEIAETGYFENDNLSDFVTRPVSPDDYNIESDDDTVKQVISFALDKVGIPYSQALRDDGNHYDCSSLVYYAYKSAGINLVYGGSNTAASEAHYCSANSLVVSEKYDAEKMKPGDLVFYSMGTNGRYKNITHVAIYCGKDMVCDASYSQKKVVYRKIYSTDKIVLIGRPSGK